MRKPFAPPELDDRPLEAGLYLVATPIGNLRDVTLRALDVLAGADLVLAEDTRVSGKLLSAFGISAKMERCDEHAEARVIPKVLARLEAGEAVALMSDAGVPLISDPGFPLVREVSAAGHKVFPVPGASAALAALTASALPTDRFFFAGFLPPKSAARKSALEALSQIPATLIFFEGGSRLSSALADMALVLGPRPAAVCRELTKLHETITRGTLGALAADPAFAAPKGELVIVVGGGQAKAASAADADRALAEALSRAGPGEAASEVSRALGLPRRDLYRRALELKEKA